MGNVSKNPNDYIDCLATGMVIVSPITDYNKKQEEVGITFFLGVDDFIKFRIEYPFKIKRVISICDCNPDLLKEFDYYEVEYENDNDIRCFICDSHGKLKERRDINEDTIQN